MTAHDQTDEYDNEVPPYYQHCPRMLKTAAERLTGSWPHAFDSQDLPAEHVAEVVLDAIVEMLELENLAMKAENGRVVITRWRA